MIYSHIECSFADTAFCVTSLWQVPGLFIKMQKKSACSSWEPCGLTIQLQHEAILLSVLSRTFELVLFGEQDTVSFHHSGYYKRDSARYRPQSYFSFSG